jgi:gas vesicle protein
MCIGKKEDGIVQGRLSGRTIARDDIDRYMSESLSNFKRKGGIGNNYGGIMDTLWDKVKKNLVDWYGTAYEKTDELARVGKKKIEITGVNRAIERNLSELGGRIYDLIVEQGKSGVIAKDTKVAELIEEVKKLDAELEEKEAEIEAIRAEKRRGPQSESNPKKE